MAFDIVSFLRLQKTDFAREVVFITPLERRNTISIQKRYLKSKPVCKVTFSLPREAVKSVKSVSIVGEFNNSYTLMLARVAHCWIKEINNDKNKKEVCHDEQ